MTQDLQANRPSRPDLPRQVAALPSSSPQVRRPPSPGPVPTADQATPPARTAARPIAGSAIPRFAPPGWRPGDAPAPGWAVRPPPTFGRGPVNVDTGSTDRVGPGYAADGADVDTGPDLDDLDRRYAHRTNVDTGPAGWSRNHGQADFGNVDTGPTRPGRVPAYAVEGNVDTDPDAGSIAEDGASGPFGGTHRTGPALGAPIAVQVPEPDEEMSGLVAARRRRIAQRREAEGIGSGPSRTLATTEMYAGLGRQLKDRYRRIHGMPLREEPDPVKFANFMLGIKATLKSSSWRVYRQAALIVIQAMDSHEAEHALALIDGAVDPDVGEARMTHVRRGADGEVERTSAHKAKSITHEQFAALLRDLPRLTHSSYVRQLGAWLIAGMATGLRPSEWEAATLSYVPDPKVRRGRRVYLHVANAKATNGRANGERRTLELTNLSDDGLDAVERFVEVATDWAHDGAFMKNKAACSRILRQISKTAFRSQNGKLLTLYTFRHQFVANMKTIYPVEELAALLGHSTVDTQGSWYGKKRSGWAPEHITDVPAPIEAEVLMIRQRFAVAQDRKRILGIMERSHAPRRSGDQAGVVEAPTAQADVGIAVSEAAPEQAAAASAGSVA